MTEQEPASYPIEIAEPYEVVRQRPKDMHTSEVMISELLIDIEQAMEDGVYSPWKWAESLKRILGQVKETNVLVTDILDQIIIQKARSLT